MSKIALCDTPAQLAKRGGKRIHISTIYRWVNRGVCGVCLETEWYAGRLCTTLEAVERFHDAVNAAKSLQRVSLSAVEVDQIATSEANQTAIREGGW